MKIKKIFAFLITAAISSLIAISFSSCSLFSENSVSALRNRAEKLRYEMSETIIDAFKSNDVNAVKNLFCPKSQELPDIDEQITKSFSFIDGEIASYKVSQSTPYESSSSNYGTVSEFSFGSEIYITTDKDKQYELYFSVQYIAEDDTIEGMTSYSVRQFHFGHKNYAICKVGYGWTSPYDSELGIISAELIKSSANKDYTALKKLMCAQSLAGSKIDTQIQSAFDFFSGKPIFNERIDGLYNSSDEETDFHCRALGYEIKKDKEGKTVRFWANVLTQNICTDSGKNYELQYVVYLANEGKEEQKGVSWFSLKDWQADEEIQVGNWIH